MIQGLKIKTKWLLWRSSTISGPEPVEILPADSPKGDPAKRE